MSDLRLDASTGVVVDHAHVDMLCGTAACSRVATHTMTTGKCVHVLCLTQYDIARRWARRNDPDAEFDCVEHHVTARVRDVSFAPIR